MSHDSVFRRSSKLEKPSESQFDTDQSADFGRGTALSIPESGPRGITKLFAGGLAHGIGSRRRLAVVGRDLMSQRSAVNPKQTEGGEKINPPTLHGRGARRLATNSTKKRSDGSGRGNDWTWE
jgi:hypothetical protein